MQTGYKHSGHICTELLNTLSLELREASNNLTEMLHSRVNKEVC
jgi:hypothetical protein